MSDGTTRYPRRELMRRVGNLAQVGGTSVIAFEDGHGRGMRAIDVRTAAGLHLQVLPDRCLDVGFAEFQGTGLAWIPPKGLAGPWYYDGDQDPHAWLRVGVGGLFNTAGLVSIGTPVDIDTSGYGFTQRMTARYGTHDRIALTPASSFRHGEEWDGDDCTLWIEGEVRQDIAYGENLSLNRRYEIDLFGRTVRLRDVVRNDGWFETPHQLLYHFNIGHPMVDDGARLLAAVEREPEAMDYSVGEDERTPWRDVTAPVEGFTFEAYVLELQQGSDGWAGVALVNRGLRPDLGGLGMYLRYDARTLPTYIAWRMMREGLYAIGFEPATNAFSTVERLKEEGMPVMLAPQESRSYELEFGLLVGATEIERFEAQVAGREQLR